MKAQVHRLVLLFLLFAFALATGCTASRPPQAGVQPQVATASAGVVVAKVGARTVSLEEIDERIKRDLQDLDERRYRLRLQALLALVDDHLATGEAAAQGLDVNVWRKAKIDDAIMPPTDEEIAALFEGSRARLPPEATLDDFRERIAMFLQQQKRHAHEEAFFAALRKEKGVEILLQGPPRERIAVAAEGPARGPSTAPITIVAFSDFECAYCGRARQTIDKIVATYGDKVRLVYRHFPLDFHKNAKQAAEASLCADEQGQFWAFHDLLFDAQDKLTVEDLKGHATALGLQAAAFASCLKSHAKMSVVEKDIEAGKRAGVSGTPAFFINGLMLSGAQPFAAFAEIIDAELAEGRVQP